MTYVARGTDPISPELRDYAVGLVAGPAEGPQHAVDDGQGRGRQVRGEPRRAALVGAAGRRRAGSVRGRRRVAVQRGRVEPRHEFVEHVGQAQRAAEASRRLPLRFVASMKTSRPSSAVRRRRRGCGSGRAFTRRPPPTAGATRPRLSPVLSRASASPWRSSRRRRSRRPAPRSRAGSPIPRSARTRLRVSCVAVPRRPRRRPCAKATTPVAPSKAGLGVRAAAN